MSISLLNLHINSSTLYNIQYICNNYKMDLFYEEIGQISNYIIQVIH